MSEKHSSSPLVESPHPDSSSSPSDEELKDVVVVLEKEKEVKVKGGENHEEENKQEAEVEAEAEAEAEEEEEVEVEDDDDDDDSGVLTVKKHVTVVPNPNPQPQSSSSSSSSEEDEDEADSELESDSDHDLAPPPPPPPPPPETSDNSTDVDPTVDKPITSIPMTMDASAKKKKKKQKKKKYSTTTTDQKPKTSGIVTSPMKQRPSKRTASETTTDNKVLEEEEVLKKRKMKKSSSSSSSTGKLHWSEDDEVVILNGLLSLRKEEGTAAKPTSEIINLLLENIKTSLQVEHVTRDQLYGKIRKLKQKYVKAKTHDSKILKLAKDIWGSTSVKGEEETTEAINGAKKEIEGKSTRSHRSKATNAVVSPKQQLHSEVPSFFNQVIESGKNCIVPPEGLKGFLAKEALGLIGSSKAKDLEEKWNKLKIAEAKIYLDRIDLVKELVELVLDAFGTEE